MINKIQHGDVVALVLAAAAVSGDFVVQGDVGGVAVTSGAIGDTVSVDTDGIFELPKATGQAWAVGNSLYWDATNKVFTTSAAAGANKRAGIAMSVNVNADVTGYVKINPFIG